MDPRGKTALITGGAHRVGKAITLALAQAGANVVVNYHSSANEAKITVEEARTFDVGALAVQANVGSLEQVEAMLTQAETEFGGVDILINSASPWIQTPFPVESMDNWHLVTKVLINGSFYCANGIAPYMLEKGDGAIINIIDETAFLPKQNYTAHSVGKSAVLGLTRQLALELSPDVSVNAVLLGPVLAPPGYDEKKLEQVAERTLFKRWGTVDDVTDAVIFLIRSSYITGEVLTIDGGERFGHKKLTRK